MAPKRQQKTKTGKVSTKDNSHLLSLKEKTLAIKRDVLQTVELMLEENITKDWFLQSCSKLCKQDYVDIVQERSIEHVCGYPLCDNAIININKQYHISCTTNKVYDITERKCFCCNECYKASNYIKAQLHDLPLYMRKEEKEPKPFYLLCDSQNKGSVGEEVVFRNSLSKDEIEEPVAEAFTESEESNMVRILNEEVKGCEEHLAKLEITENIFEKPFVFGSEKHIETTKISSDSSAESNEEDEIKDDNMFPKHDNVSILSNKLMPIPENTKKAILISPIKPIDISQPASVKLSVEFINKAFQDWFTEDTMKYLLGEKKFYSLKADALLQSMISSDSSPSSDKILALKKDYIEICLKIDNLKEEGGNDSAEDDIPDMALSSKSKKNDSEMLCIKADPELEKTTLKPRPKRKSKEKKNRVSFKEPSKQQENSLPSLEKFIGNKDSETENALPDPTFPLVDSVAQNALRKQLLTSKLKTVYSNILPTIGLHYRDIRKEILQIVETFSLTPVNVTYKPKEWKCIALVLFRILSKTTLKNDFQDNGNVDFSKLYKSVTDTFISTSEIEELASHLISSEQLKKLQGSYVNNK
ncbi:putative RNA polymerase II subunit B1 CTD phosphatase RPAP2 [Caerostris darwini]|uniref:RNA polymerase II subunit B1 CTD phosphatase RPAP2 homolog n=1 Tax=Caerostris darwini TaxID=1538125 RepID=A0AAV4RB18_9ARAC|nr:putative RNA polymerase II subunit B1 CTD phosphatase RPAP2 [Caerostris darwini]